MSERATGGIELPVSGEQELRRAGRPSRRGATGPRPVRPSARRSPRVRCGRPLRCSCGARGGAAAMPRDSRVRAGGREARVSGGEPRAAERRVTAGAGRVAARPWCARLAAQAAATGAVTRARCGAVALGGGGRSSRRVRAPVSARGVGGGAGRARAASRPELARGRRPRRGAAPGRAGPPHGGPMPSRSPRRRSWSASAASAASRAMPGRPGACGRAGEVTVTVAAAGTVWDVADRVAPARPARSGRRWSTGSSRPTRSLDARGARHGVAGARWTDGLMMTLRAGRKRRDNSPLRRAAGAPSGDTPCR